MGRRRARRRAGGGAGPRRPRRGVAHLHAHFASAATTVARLAARLAGITYSFTAHAKDIFHSEVRDEDLRAKLVDAADVVTISDFNLGHLRDRFGPAADRVRRVYNGLELAAFPHTAPADRPPVVAAVGRLVEKKVSRTFSTPSPCCVPVGGRSPCSWSAPDRWPPRWPRRWSGWGCRTPSR
ncbi:hypothetical protein [Blastococcus brunescens]|uniref:Glycosyltransferase subfamily 4-like N-terminal domain-containing protein n=1 Tax=Blastococcus brunescens TaxID=1564165 RepID=A0ABZ1B9D4_9ACTN|nr:hypothetical protein [Blastococcus sp. BMG 8361]WRL67364.1 hypothetical protein U6N30_10260 [Blastococcus sp. BMG 8361]